METFWELLQSNDIVIEDVFFQKQTKGWMIPNRVIQNNLATFCISGTGTYQAQGKSFAVQPGRMIIISHGVAHSGTQDDNDPIHVIAFRFRLSRDTMPKSAFVVDVEHAELVIEILKQLYTYWIRHSTQASHESILIAYAKALFSMLYVNQTVHQRAQYDPWMDAVNRTIETSIQTGQTIPLERFIATSGSQYLFLKQFKDSHGMTYKNYLYVRKMEYAKMLLNETSLSIQEIAAKLQYSDPYIFSNQFKKAFAISPRGYRNRNHKNDVDETHLPREDT